MSVSAWSPLGKEQCPPSALGALSLRVPKEPAWRCFNQV